MNKVWECVVDVFLGILIIIISVTVYFGLRTETVIKSMYVRVTEEFIDNVKKNGVLTVEDYENYIERMGAGNSLFNIFLEHRYKIYEPEYRFKTLEEIMDEQKKAYTKPNEYHYREVITEKPHVDDPINDGSLNTETNESILAKAVDTPSDPNHIHNESCYFGHKHSGEPMFIHTHKHDYNCVEYEQALYISFTCGQCGNKERWTLAVWYWDEASGSARFSHSYNPYCTNCRSTSFSNSSYSSSYCYSCGYNIDINNDGLYDAVGTEVTYSYKREHPMPRSVKTSRTITSGCYKYHEMGSLPVYYYDYYGTPFYKPGDLYTLINTGFTSFCKIPSTIELMYIYGYEDDEYYGLNFHVQYNDGVISFKCRPGTYLNSLEVFPAVDLATFRNLVDNSDELLNFLRENVKYKYIVSSGRYSEISRVYGELILCDEAIHDTWYTTCGLEEDGMADCNEIIASLTPTHSTQKVYTNDPLITTAIAVYKDGSSKTVVCTTNFSTGIVQENKTATLSYSYTIDGVTYTKNCSITVTVIPRNKTCVKGHIYNLNEDGSDPGCPYCRAWVDSIRIVYPTTLPIVITIGTTLQDNHVKLLVTYMDGHTEELTDGYMDNLDSTYLGTKPVTIGYKGVSITVSVTTVCASIICDICGYSYELYPDRTNPGCPKCIQKIPVFTGNIMIYEHLINSEEILDVLYSKKKYFFNVDDVFGVSVQNKSSTIARKILKKIYPSLTDRWFTIEKKEHVLCR